MEDRLSGPYSNSLEEKVSVASAFACLTVPTGCAVGYLSGRVLSLAIKGPWMLCGSIQGVAAAIFIVAFNNVSSQRIVLPQQPGESVPAKVIKTCLGFTATVLSGYGIGYLSGYTVTLAAAVGLAVSHTAVFAIAAGLYCVCVVRYSTFGR